MGRKRYTVEQIIRKLREAEVELARGLKTPQVCRKRAEHRDHVWSYDFVFDRTQDGRPLRTLVVVDEYTRECLATRTARRQRSEEVIDCLADPFVRRATPVYLRSDNGSEFTADVVRDWLGRLGVTTLFIAPGSPWENGYVESLKRSILTLRLDWLSGAGSDEISPLETVLTSGGAKGNSCPYNAVHPFNDSIVQSFPSPACPTSDRSL